MGCCSSRQQDASPYGAPQHNPDHPDASSRHIIAGSNRTSSISHPVPPVSTAHTPNQPLKPIPQDTRAKLPSPTQATSVHNSGPWTRARLARERNDWWDTRTEGSRYIWQTYQQAVQLVQEGDLKNAQALIDAADCTCPTGELWKRIYDNQGVEYSVNRAKWVVLEPDGIVPDEQPQHEGTSNETARHDIPQAGSSTTPVPASQSPKTTSPTSHQISDSSFSGKVTCRLSDTGRDVHLTIDPDSTVSDLIRAIDIKVGYFDKRLRVAFLGHEHYPDEFLRDFYQEKKVLTVMVLPAGVQGPLNQVYDRPE